MFKSKYLLAAPLAVALTASGASGLAAARPAAPNPGGFTAHVTNPWFPLKPGSVRRYTGMKDGKRAFDVKRVTHRTKRIQGVPTIVLDDRLYLNGRLAERTLDYYTQDRRGNVWYFGEDTATLRPNGTVESREGSFRAGRDGARAGIYMTAHPEVGQTRQQEFYKGHAEDSFTVRSLQAHVKVPFGSFERVLRTTERTPLEPKILDAKYSVRGVGVALETQIKGPGPRERLALVSFTRG